MKIRLSLIIIILILVSGSLTVNAQQSLETDSKPNSYKLLIPELNVLIDSALANNGMRNYRILEIEAKSSNLKSKRRAWTRNFGIQADTRYGTFDNFSSNISGPNTTTLSSYTKQLNYGIGLYLKIPLFDFLNRKAEIKQANAELAQAESLVKSQDDEIKEMVIRYYEDLILKQNLLELEAINLGSARVNMEMVEKEFRNGLIPIYEYVRVSDITSRVAAQYEKSKSEFLVSKKLLENLAGISIN
ncbi:MAG: TolC family protein [Flavobacteriaceae bacterium]|nr:MAG: TolC family protein [Flavobacteriaceae bacterium]